MSAVDLREADLSATDIYYNTHISFEQILSAMRFEKVKLSPALQKRLKNRRAKQAKEKQSADEDSSGDEKKS